MKLKYLLSVSLIALSACSTGANNGVSNLQASPTANTSATPTPAPVISASPDDTQAVLAEYQANYESFKLAFDTNGKTYQGAIQMLFQALLEIESDPKLAEYLVSVVLNGKQMYESSDSISGYDIGNSARFMLDQLKSKPEAVRSYIGGTPEKNYADFDAKNLPVQFPENGTEINGVKVDNTIDAPGATKGRVYIMSNGKDFPTPINLEQNASGLWKINVNDLSSLATGVKKAEKTDF